MRSRVKHVAALLLLTACSVCLADQRSWNPADAARDAETDIRAGKIAFCWHGSIASMPVGVPLELAKRYPQINAGTTCNVTDQALFERQGEYAGRYNATMLAYVRTTQ